MGRAAWPARRWYLVALVVAVVSYFGTPDTWTQTICYDAIAMSGAVAMLAGVRHHRPPAAGLWLTFGLCQVLMVCGDFTYALYARTFHTSPYPAPADAMYLTASVLEIIVLALVLRRRVPERDIAGIIEAT